MTPQEELQFWREMARAADPGISLFSLADAKYHRVIDDALWSVSERAHLDDPEYPVPFIARQITRLEREIGSEQ